MVEVAKGIRGLAISRFECQSVRRVRKESLRIHKCPVRTNENQGEVESVHISLFVFKPELRVEVGEQLSSANQPAKIQ
jgi:hypothetical protein